MKVKETEKIHEFKTATRHLRERTRFPLLLKQPENMQGCGQRHLNVRNDPFKRLCNFLMTLPPLPSPSLVVNQQSTFYRPLPLYTPLNTTDPLCLKTT